MGCHAKGTELELGGLQRADIAKEEHFQEKTACCSQAFCILSPLCVGEGVATHTEVLSAGPQLGALLPAAQDECTAGVWHEPLKQP